MKINFSQEKKNPNTLCTSLPHCLLSLLPYWAFLLKDFYRLLKRCSSRVVRSHDSVMYADRLKVMPWRFYQDKIIMSLLFIWGERKSKQNKSNTGILGLSVGCFLFSSNTLLSPRNKNMSVLEKGKNSKYSSLYVCTCGKISGHKSPMKSGGQSALLWRRRKTCSHILFRLLTNGIKPSWYESTRLRNFGVGVYQFSRKGFTPVPMQGALHNLTYFAYSSTS